MAETPNHDARRRLSRRDLLKWTAGAALLPCASDFAAASDSEASQSPIKVPCRAITTGPKHHWFGYYDKLQFCPDDRHVLGMEVDFEGRSPRPDDVIRIGMVDLDDQDRWTTLGTTKAWCWQQGCMLQWVPETEKTILWNDRDHDRFVCHVMDVSSGDKRTIDAPVYTIAPCGTWAVGLDFRRVNDMRPGYGYCGLADPNADKLAPADSGLFRVDLKTGASELIVSLADVAALPAPGFDLSTAKHYFNHVLVNTDSSRIEFLHRWREDYGRGRRFITRMLTCAPDGSDIRIVDPSGHTSHFIWRDPNHILAWSRPEGHGDGFYLFEDKTGGQVTPVGAGVMTRNGHCTYLPGNEWILNDTYPDADRNQHVYLYEVASGRRVPLGAFHTPKQYTGEWRVDTHPRSSRNGQMVCIDTPHFGGGRQLALMDISGIVQ